MLRLFMRFFTPLVLHLLLGWGASAQAGMAHGTTAYLLPAPLACQASQADTLWASSDRPADVDNHPDSNPDGSSGSGYCSPDLPDEQPLRPRHALAPQVPFPCPRLSSPAPAWQPPEQQLRPPRLA